MKLAAGRGREEGSALSCWRSLGRWGAPETSVITLTLCFHVSHPVLSSSYELAPSFHMQSPEDNLITSISQTRTLRHRGETQQVLQLAGGSAGIGSPADCLQSPTLPHNSRSPRWRAVRGYFYPQRTPGNICRRFQLSQLEECYRILEGKAKDAVNLLPGSRQVPALNHSAPNVSDGASQVLQWYKPACQCRRL